jgi:hypothetical protein
MSNIITLTQGIDYPIAHQVASWSSNIVRSVPNDPAVDLYLEPDAAHYLTVGDTIYVAHKAGYTGLQGPATVDAINGNVVTVTMLDTTYTGVRGGADGQVWKPQDVNQNLLYISLFSSPPGIGKHGYATASIDAGSRKLLVRDLTKGIVQLGDVVTLDQAGIIAASVERIYSGVIPALNEHYTVLEVDQTATASVSDQSVDIRGGILAFGEATPSNTVAGLLAGVIDSATIETLARFIPPPCKPVDCCGPIRIGCYEKLLVRGERGAAGTATYYATQKSLIESGELWYQPTSISALEMFGIKQRQKY